MNKIQNKINNRFPKENLEVLVYSTCKEYMKIRCNNCNKEYDFSIAENGYRKSKRCVCKDCYDKVSISNSKYIQKILKEMDEIEERYVLIEYDFSKVKSSITCKCRKCGYIRKTTNEAFAISIRCPKCEVKNVKLSQSEAELEILKASNNKLSLIGEYKGNNKRTTMKCMECGFIWGTSPSHIKAGTRCPKCNQKESKGEAAISRWLTKNGIAFEQEYPIHEGSRQKFDFFIKDINLAIEFNGIQHYEPREFFGGDIEFEKTKERDIRKYTYCDENKINLLIIKYSDYKHLDKILLSTFNDYYVASSDAKQHTSHVDDDIVSTSIER